MNNKSPRLIINKLILVGRKKNYIVPFHNGLNVIYGDSDTGKSSIFNLINYCLGSKKVDMYDELEYNGQYCMLELSLNGKTYTVKRDIFNTNEYVEVYYSDIENMNNVFPYEYSPNYNKEGRDGYFSDFLLQSLNIPLIKVKKSPSKIDSEFVRLSFRDIFKFCYIDQDDVGSKYLLDGNNAVIFTRNKEIFKFIHNVLDSQIIELENDMASKSRVKKELEKKYSIISTFLRETQIKPIDMLKSELLILDDQLDSIKFEIKDLNTKMLSNINYNNELRDLIQEFKNMNLNIGNKIKMLEMNIEQNIRLKKEYLKDITKLKSAIEVKSKLPLKINKEVDCPVCCKKIKVEELKECLGENNITYLKAEVNGLKRRKENLVQLIDSQVNDIEILYEKKKKVIKDLNKAEILMDSNTKDYISPYISQRDGLIDQNASIKEQKSSIEYLIKLRNQLDLINNDISYLKIQIDDLKIKVDELKNNAPSTAEIVSSLGDYLKEFLEFVKIKNAVNISVSNKTFLPVVRNKDYVDLTSGGLRTLTSVGYFTSLLKNSLATRTNIPSFLMIDTIGKYLGKTKERYLDETDKKQDESECIKDPDKYLKIYKYLIDICNKNEDIAEFQILIIDNEIPVEIEKSIDKYFVKRFSTEGEDGFEVGFINDII